MSRFSQKARTQPGMATIHVQAVEAAYRGLQRSQRALVAMLVVCAVLGMKMQGPPGTLGNRIFLPVILATSLLTLAYTLRNSLVLVALADLRRNPRDPKLLRRWSRHNLLVQALCAAVGLTGFAL
jgi:hypothetical protein